MLEANPEPGVISYNAEIRGREKGKHRQWTLALLCEMWKAKPEFDAVSHGAGSSACGMDEQRQRAMALLTEIGETKLEVTGISPLMQHHLQRWGHHV